jgi:hypothetical protein
MDGGGQGRDYGRSYDIRAIGPVFFQQVKLSLGSWDWLTVSVAVYDGGRSTRCWRGECPEAHSPLTENTM